MPSPEHPAPIAHATLRKDKGARRQNTRVIRWLGIISAAVLAVAGFVEGVDKIYRTTIEPLIPKRTAQFEIVDASETASTSLDKAKAQRIAYLYSVGEGMLVIPRATTDRDVWLEATCSADAFEGGFAGVSILYGGKTLIEGESQVTKQPGILSGSVVIRLKVYARNAVEFGVRGADHNAKRKNVTLAAYSVERVALIH